MVLLSLTDGIILRLACQITTQNESIAFSLFSFSVYAPKKQKLKMVF